MAEGIYSKLSTNVSFEVPTKCCYILTGSEIQYGQIIIDAKLKKGRNKCDPRSLTFVYFNLHFIKIINTKYCIWSTCTYENKIFKHYAK